MMLAQAFVTSKTAGFQLSVRCLDGTKQWPLITDPNTINVAVMNGLVCKSWIKPPTFARA